ncbi:hypothetical protein COO91_05986 [Nostoc flagelliforme CCNUN1]|uniref:Uncharacterized protein n=1 Tax=Nostoc flagelliforme CCNUN1 TaxID=2038116 RepID=A0A2K8SX87_9NOSO|nr:hypothetical protein COO91_05986 [Nostoc flagelliforme CCNUN1]
MLIIKSRFVQLPLTRFFPSSSGKRTVKIFVKGCFWQRVAVFLRLTLW